MGKSENMFNEEGLEKVTMYSREKLVDYLGEGFENEKADMYNLFFDLVHNEGKAKGKNMAWKFRMYQKTAPFMLRWFHFLLEQQRRLMKENDALEGKSVRNCNSRWTNEEDELLIDMITGTGSVRAESSVQDIAVKFGRTASAVQSRITHLVGKRRLSQDIAGKFVGIIDGEVVSADIDGTLYKEAS